MSPGRNETTRHKLEAAAKLHSAGQLFKAEQLYREILQSQPNHPEAMHLLGVLAGQCSQFAEAIKLINQAVLLKPDFPEAFANLGRLYADTGDLPNAVNCYRKAAQLRPLDAQIKFALGIALRLSDQIDAARHQFQEAIRLDTRMAEAYCELGTLCRMKGETDAAVTMQRAAIALKPGLADAHNGLANALVDNGEFEAAIISYRRAIELNSSNPAFHRNLGSVLERLKRLEEAMKCYQYVLQQNPGDVESLISKGRIQLDRQQYDAAIDSVQQALRWAPANSSAYQVLGEVYSGTRDYAAAEAAFAKVLEFSPQSANGLVGLGAVFKALGRFAEAGATFRAALKISPDDVDALKHLTVLGMATESDLALLTNQLTKGQLTSEDSVAAEFAIGKQLDDANRYDEAFEHYERGNLLVQKISETQGPRFSRQNLQSAVDKQIQNFTPEFFDRWSACGAATQTPVFIVGMPRSGTSLTEQILASHSKVFGAGELSDITEIAKLLPDPMSWKCDVIRQQAEQQLRRMTERAPAAERVIDKMPGNIFYLGLIAALFPNARVIFCRRDPRDNCLSCYFQWFADHGLPFTYDLADCGTQWKEQDRLEKHMLQNLPVRMTVVQYETLVGDLEGQSRRLIDFLGLQWEPGCLEFHKTKRSVSTASVWQVRQPLYSSSVGRWKHYEKHLGPLFQALGPTR